MKTSTRLIGIGLAVVIGLGLLAAGFVFARSGWGMFGYAPGMMDGNFGFGMMNGFGFGGILPILFWLVIIGLGVWLISRLASNTNGQSPTNRVALSESAFDILKKRYARGEITKEQFDAMRRDIVE